MTFDILGFGACAVDDLLYVDEFPRPDGKVRVQQRLRAGGGLTATALVAASRLGATTTWCGALGDDELSRFSLDELRREGVGTSHVSFQPDARPNYSVIVIERPTGSRSILSCNDGVTPFPAGEVTAELIASCRILFVDHTVVETAIRAATLAKKQGIPVVADIERVNMPGLAELLPLIDHLIIGLEAGRPLSGEIEPEKVVRALMCVGRICCAVTDGTRGCWFTEQGREVHHHEVRHQPAFPIETVDTTGCGDVFHGAYLACLARGTTIAAAIRFASAVAALKATQPGGRAGIPNRAVTEDFLRQNSS